MTGAARLSSHGRFLGLGLLVLAVLVSGCARTDRSCPVTGRLLVNQRPAYGVYLMFHASDGSGTGKPSASARTDAAGAFSLRVPEPGEYAITAFWPAVTVQDGETVEGNDLFKGTNLEPQRPVAKVTIVRGDPVLPPIDLSFNFGNP